jgi:hypothetical protein
LGTPREEEWRQLLVGGIYQAIIASECISRKLGLREVENHIITLRVEYEGRLDCLPPNIDAEALNRTMKK